MSRSFRLHPSPRAFRAIAAASIALVAVSSGVISAPPARADVPAPTQLIQIPPLSSDQKQRIETRRAKLNSDLAALREDKSRSEAEKKKSFQKLETDYAVDITAILTPEQRVAIQKRQKQEEVIRTAREAEFRTVTEQILSISNKLHKSLTKDQSKQLDQAKADVRSKSEAIKADSSLTADQKSTRITELERGLEKKVASILTADQRSQFQKIESLEQRQIQLINGAEPQP